MDIATLHAIIRSLRQPQGYQSPIDPTSYRHGDTSMKATGFLGPQTNQRGQATTEYSIGLPVNGKQTEMPSMVPTLTQDELKHILSGGELTPEIVQKAKAHFMARQSRGLPAFAGNDEAIMPRPSPYGAGPQPQDFLNLQR